MKAIILAGGGGTRLFPLSRESQPKQFLKLPGRDSLFCQTIRRFLTILKPEDIMIVTNEKYVQNVRQELISCSAETAKIVVETEKKNTAPAVALALKNLVIDENEPVIISPADHAIEDDAAFCALCQQAFQIAKQGYLVTIGISPTEANTGYGYIKPAAFIENKFFQVDSFREKPDKQTAMQYIKDGYLWNAGIFIAQCSHLVKLYETYAPEIYGFLYNEEAKFEDLPAISFDYAIAEKATLIAVGQYQGGWYDMGTWDALYKYLPKDQTENAVLGETVLTNCKNSLIVGGKRLIAGIDLEDLLIIETSDVLLVAKKGESQKVKDIVDKLKLSQNPVIENHPTVHRPWGTYSVLNEASGYKVKKIVVNPKQKLSLQLHYHRSEHWIVIQGTAKVTVDTKEQLIHKNESVFVPQATKHCLENPGILPLEIIEVQNGEYLGEDDIVRFNDIYGRV